ncbi:MAG: hypothetical protein HUU06_04075 [Planctomycetaceae bacterium]|nr:hypothetical protein [Planctomycetaceae bacterium]
MTTPGPDRDSNQAAPEDARPLGSGVPSHGIRFSVVDGIVLVVGSALTWPLWRFIGPFALLLPVTLVHFFLFCNVFRIRRPAELLWGAVFLVNFSGWALSGAFSWWPVLSIQSAVTVAILVVETRHPTYHGIFSRRRGG